MTRSFIPNPVDVAAEILAAQARPVLPYSSPEFEAIYRRNQEKFKHIFGLDTPVFLGGWNTNSMQEAAVRSLVAGRLLVGVNGTASRTWLEIAQANGKQVDGIEAEWGEAITIELLAEALQKQTYDALALVHVDPGTGTANPLADLAGTLHEISPETLLVVDASASLGGMPVLASEWGIDVLITISHGCLGLPPGLGAVAATARALKHSESVQDRGWASDLSLWDKHNRNNLSALAAPTTLLYALDVQLERLIDEGLENRWQRHAQLARRVEVWLQDHGFNLLAAEPIRSDTIVCAHNSRGWAYQDLSRFLLQRGLRIANGHGMLKDRSLRIAVMGDTSHEDVDDLLTALDEYDRKQPG